MNQIQHGPGALSPALARLPHLSRFDWLAALALSAAAALLPGLWTLPGFVGLIVALAILARPELAVYLLALSVPFGSLLEVEAGKFSITPTEGLVGLLAVGWIGRAFARGRLEVPRTPLLVPLAAMLFAIAISGYQATELTLTIKEGLKWLELALVYLFIVTEMSAARQSLLLLLLLLTGAAVEALLGSAQFVLGLGPDSFGIGRFMRAYGTFEQPNPYAGYLGMLIPIAVGLLLTRPTRAVRYYALAACLLAATAVGMSLSRGAWVGILLALSLMMVFWSRRSRILLVAGGVAAMPLAALAFLNLLPYEVASRLATAADYFRFIDVRTEVVTSQNWAVVERVAHWQAALDMIADYPLLGVGAGNYPAVYELYFLPGWLDPLGHAHNFYLNIAAETGIPGLLIYLSILLAAFAHSIRWLVRSGGSGAHTPLPLTAQEAGRPLAEQAVPFVGHGFIPCRPASVGDEAAGDKPPAPRYGISRGGDDRRERSRLLRRGILVGVLGALIASSLHNMFDSLFVHSMSVQLGMILALGQVSANALSKQAS